MNFVLKSIKPVVKDSKYVSIDKRKLKEVAERFSKEELKIPDWKLDVFIDEDTERTIDFFFLGNTINFAFKDFNTKEKFETLYRNELWKGSTGMWASLKRTIEEGIPLLEGDYLRRIDKTNMKKIFTGNIEIPMLDERLEIFHEVGGVLEENYDGHFYNLVEASNGLAFTGGGIIAKLISDFPSFNDVAEFKGKQVKFYKRAQLAVAMTYGRLRNTGLFNVKDIDDLTVFADYVLPVSLRGLGIMKLDKDLEERIDRQELIEKGSREEIELRANTIHACNLLKKEMSKSGRKVNALHLDYKLWSEGRKYKDKKHHLTKTIFY